MIAALERIEELDIAIADALVSSGINKMQNERNELDAAVKEYVVTKGDIETDTYKLTRVQGFRRAWDGDKLAKLLPKGMFLKIVDYIPNSEKIDELVRAGKIDAKKIKSAYIETPNNPYAKITKKKQDDGDDEAARVAEALA